MRAKTFLQSRGTTKWSPEGLLFYCHFYYGGFCMTNLEKNKITELRKQGLGYRKISRIVGISENTVKSFCSRTKNSDKGKDVCKECGKPLIQTKGVKRKIFCSGQCRMKWWNNHKELLNRKKIREYICPCCGKTFSVYGNVKRKYCSYDCYIEDRFGGHSDE